MYLPITLRPTNNVIAEWFIFISVSVFCDNTVQNIPSAAESGFLCWKTNKKLKKVLSCNLHVVGWVIEPYHNIIVKKICNCVCLFQHVLKLTTLTKQNQNCRELNKWVFWKFATLTTILLKMVTVLTWFTTSSNASSNRRSSYLYR